MRPIAFLRQMLAQGMDMETAMQAAEAFETSAADEHERLVTDLLDRLGVDAKADERRRRDRERKAAKKAGIPRNSAESAEAEDQKVSPTPPSKTNPPNGGIYTSRTREADFAAFWSAYPSKVGKRLARKAYDRAINRIDGPDPPGTILAGVERAKLTRKWREGYVPNPATWLNQDRWEDQPAEVVPLRPPDERPDPIDRKRDQLATNFAGAQLAIERRAIERAGG